MACDDPYQPVACDDPYQPFNNHYNPVGEQGDDKVTKTLVAGSQAVDTAASGKWLLLVTWQVDALYTCSNFEQAAVIIMD